MLNDLYFPGWQAEIEGRQTAIYPTNAVMRGVVVPAGARQVQFRFVSRSEAPGSWVFQVGALLLLAALAAGLRYKAKQ